MKPSHYPQETCPREVDQILNGQSSQLIRMFWPNQIKRHSGCIQKKPWKYTILEALWKERLFQGRKKPSKDLQRSFISANEEIELEYFDNIQKKPPKNLEEIFEKKLIQMDDKMAERQTSTWNTITEGQTWDKVNFWRIKKKRVIKSRSKRKHAANQSKIYSVSCISKL